MQTECKRARETIEDFLKRNIKATDSINSLWKFYEKITISGELDVFVKAVQHCKKCPDCYEWYMKYIEPQELKLCHKTRDLLQRTGHVLG
jgi:5'(3')-deoxyribonucleotidase